MRAFVSWSGGKETSLACYKTMQNGPVEIGYLLNMTSQDGKYSRSHGVNSAFLKAQSNAIGIPIIQKKTTWDSYEEVFKRAVLDLKKEGIDTGIFGDIDLQEHRDWVERICRDVGIRPLLPLWKEKRKKLLKHFIDLGFKAIIIATGASSLGKEWLGRKIDSEFIKGLQSYDSIDLCGEKGEYHTFVYDGPIFRKSVEFTFGERILKDEHWFLELIPKEKA